MLDVLDEEGDEVAEGVKLRPAEEDGDADGCEGWVAPDGVRDYGGLVEAVLAVTPEDKGWDEDAGEGEEGDVGGGVDCGCAGGYHCEDVGEGGDAGGGDGDADTVDVVEEAFSAVMEFCSLRRGEGEKGPREDKDVERCADVITEAPADGIDQDPAHDEPKGETDGLAAAQKCKCHITAPAGREVLRDQTDGRGHAHGHGDALESAEDDELDARSGEGAAEGEGGEEGASCEEDGAIADDVGDGAGEEERAACCECEDGGGPEEEV